ncbi:MAG TPA: UDP-N-acetylglucosamine--N-acetylmuramyl-(pentapeptide) pyrophosphoryl-undecaprenol N-acetylglucosamine transferase [bacterium]|nr:UDP-N-acetylglucosamine--N-acetylmuramyl-(pentapeptide) pyrophosphoryl-undecaprenol N-acetylglucosamine transferase [bacterium]HPQ67014.1 UDP-N-acetylglucosamine--N-acetylmuramyl-(pentapeptide) pyrophosphoryl-undecaprenol N-acetylglucosamine transferase [bacterium]
MKIAVAGGGTGGHLAPALALADAIRAEGGKMIFLTSLRSAPAFERQLRGVRIEEIPTAPVSRSPAAAARSVVVNWRGYRRALRVLSRERPALVLGTGGYPSIAPALAGRRLELPLVLYEANTVAGRANRWLASRAAALIRALPPAPGWTSPVPEFVTGPAVWEKALRPAPTGFRQSLGLDPEIPTVLVMGGSHGARGINLAVSAALSEWRQRGCRLQFVHLAGKGMEEGLASRYREAGFRARVFPFYAEMGRLYSIADLAITRAGASTVAELAANRVPAVYIPYPAAADDHQYANALYMQERGAARAIREEEGPGTVAAAVADLAASPSARARMSASAQQALPSGAVASIMNVLRAAVARRLD